VREGLGLSSEGKRAFTPKEGNGGERESPFLRGKKGTTLEGKEKSFLNSGKHGLQPKEKKGNEIYT